MWQKQLLWSLHQTEKSLFRYSSRWPSCLAILSAILNAWMLSVCCISSKISYLCAVQGRGIPLRGLRIVSRQFILTHVVNFWSKYWFITWVNPSGEYSLLGSDSLFGSEMSFSFSLKAGPKEVSANLISELKYHTCVGSAILASLWRLLDNDKLFWSIMNSLFIFPCWKVDYSFRFVAQKSAIWNKVKHWLRSV